MSRARGLVRELAGELDALLASRLWRLTAPLRSLSLGARRLLGGLRRLEN